MIFDYVPCANTETYHGGIWGCWWQGVENAPDIVMVCIQSIIRNAGAHRVLTLTEKNYQDYASLLAETVKMYRMRVISKTYYSNLVSLSLLTQYGGLWLNATFYAAAPFIEEVFSYLMFSIKRPGYNHLSVLCGEFVNYALGCNYENRDIWKS